MADLRNKIVKDRRKHIVFVVADGLATVELGVIEDIADLICDSPAGITYGDQIFVDLSVL